jgi:hypothetical protein
VGEQGSGERADGTTFDLHLHGVWEGASEYCVYACAHGTSDL